MTDPITDHGGSGMGERETRPEGVVRARLCDDDGMVSAEPYDGPFDGTYLGFMNHLRGISGHAPYVGDAFACTGGAHLAHETFRCTSPAHAVAVAIRGDDLEGPPWPAGLVAVILRRPQPGPTAGTMIGLDLVQTMEALGIGYGDEFSISRLSEAGFSPVQGPSEGDQ